MLQAPLWAVGWMQATLQPYPFVRMGAGGVVCFVAPSSTSKEPGWAVPRCGLLSLWSCNPLRHPSTRYLSRGIAEKVEDDPPTIRCVQGRPRTSNHHHPKLCVIPPSAPLTPPPLTAQHPSPPLHPGCCLSTSPTTRMQGSAFTRSARSTGGAGGVGARTCACSMPTIGGQPWHFSKCCAGEVG